MDIQRSNGRIHSAVISGVNSEVQSVTVEWFEGGETKGKEVRTCNTFNSVTMDDFLVVETFKYLCFPMLYVAICRFLGEIKWLDTYPCTG